MELQMMRMPRYARGLQLARIGVFLMLAQLAVSVVVTVKALTGSGAMVDWVKYLYWANVGAAGLMALGTWMALLDLRAAKLPVGRLVISIVAFGITIAIWMWSFHVINGLFDIATGVRDTDVDVDNFESFEAMTSELSRNMDRVDNLKWFVVLKDLVYPIGLAGIVHSIRQTAIANDHYALRDAAGNVTTLVVGMCICDVVAQFISMVPALGMLTALLALAALLFTLGFWIYVHLRLAKFFKAASILVNEEHNLPMAQVVVRKAAEPPEVASAPSPPVRPKTATGPSPALRAPNEPSKPSQPIIVAAAELRSGPVPRAETAPGAPVDEPKLLR